MFLASLRISAAPEGPPPPALVLLLESWAVSALVPPAMADSTLERIELASSLMFCLVCVQLSEAGLPDCGLAAYRCRDVWRARYYTGRSRDLRAARDADLEIAMAAVAARWPLRPLERMLREAAAPIILKSEAIARVLLSGDGKC